MTRIKHVLLLFVAAIMIAGTGCNSKKKEVEIKTTVDTTAIQPDPIVIAPDDPLTTGVRDATKDFSGVTATVNDGVITVVGELKAEDWKRLKISLDGLHPKRVDASGLKISK